MRIRSKVRKVSGSPNCKCCLKVKVSPAFPVTSVTIKLAAELNNIKFSARVETAVKNSQASVSVFGISDWISSTAGALEIKLESITVSPNKFSGLSVKLVEKRVEKTRCSQSRINDRHSQQKTIVLGSIVFHIKSGSIPIIKSSQTKSALHRCYVFISLLSFSVFSAP